MSADDRLVPIDENEAEVAGWLAGLGPEAMDAEATKIARALFLALNDVEPQGCPMRLASMALGTVAGGLALARDQAAKSR